MKKIVSGLLAAALVAVLALPVFAVGEKTLTVGASPVPHAELLNLVKDDLKKQGITLKVIEFTDYVTPNSALIAGDLDANYFQHIPYLETNAEWSSKLANAFGVHIEPIGLYADKKSKVKKIGDLKDGARIAIPNDPTNGGRALLLLQAKGLLTLNPGVGLTATVKDIASNPRNFKFTELEAAQLPRSLPDVDVAIINTNYALEAGLDPVKNALLREDSKSPYVNIVVVQKGHENDETIVALKKALQSKKVRDFIAKQYKGAVVVAF
jgi:D-methionine transport system substrate-binding protein